MYTLKKVLNSNNLSSEVLNLSPEELDKLLLTVTEKKESDRKIQSKHVDFETFTKSQGSNSPKEYLIMLGYLPNPDLKRPRIIITDEIRKMIVKDLIDKVPTHTISERYDVTEDSVYNIKGKNGLTKNRIKSPSVESEPVLSNVS